MVELKEIWATETDTIHDSDRGRLVFLGSPVFALVSDSTKIKKLETTH